MTTRCVYRLSITLLVATAGAWAQPPEEKGLAIAEEAHQRNIGWGDSAADLVMTIRDDGGKETERKMRSLSLENEDEGHKTLLVIEYPPDVKGTALLTHSHKDRSDDQWIYLPALKRVKRIAGTNRSGPFLGSEFSYEDLAPLELERFTYRYLRDETLDGVPCFVIERTPVDKDSGYKRQVAWIDQDEYRVRKVDYYDRNDNLLKTLVLSDYEKYLDRYWRAQRFEMVNHQNGRSTTLELSNMKLKTGLTDRDFDTNSLSRVR